MIPQRLILSRLSFALLAALSGASSADEMLASASIESLYGSTDFISLATGNPQRIERAPAVADVITAEQIKTAGATTLDQVLEMVPGLHVGRSSIRLDAIYTLRGFTATFSPGVLMMVNGVSIDTVFFGSRFSGFRMPVAAIERVEVIRGPGSAVYGADAFVGVINIVTHNADSLEGGEAGLRSGSFDTDGAWAQYGEAISPGLKLSASVEWQRSSGDPGRRIAGDQQTLLDGWFGTAASQAPGPLDTAYGMLNTHLELNAERWDLRLWNWRLDDGGYGPGVAQALNGRSFVDDEVYLLDFAYHDQPHPDWEVELRANHLHWNSDYYLEMLPSGTVVPIGDDGNLFTPGGGLVNFTDGVLIALDGRERHYGVEGSAVYGGMDDHRWRLAAGASVKEFETSAAANYGPGVLDGTRFTPSIGDNLVDLTGTPYMWAPNKSRAKQFLSIQDEWSFAPDWVATAGARYDHYSDFGGTLNPRLALVWQTNFDLTSKLLYGRAFRPPAFVELYTRNNPSQLGNPDLQPEVIDTLELALDYRPPGPVQGSLNLFAYDSERLIRFQPDPATSAILAQNAGAQSGHGLEAEGEWRINDALRLGADLAWVSAEEGSGDVVADVPTRQMRLWADWALSPNWRLFTQATYVGGRKRISGDPRDAIGDYTLVDLTLRHAPRNQPWEAALIVHNAFDRDAREPSPGDPTLPGGSAIPEDYPLEGRSLMIEFRYRL